MKIIYLFVLICALVYAFYPVNKCINDVHQYCIKRDSENKKYELLKEISRRYDKMIYYLNKEHAMNKITKNINERLTDSTKYVEIMDSKYIAYSKNKGEELSFCLEKGDINSLMFVAIHELAHIATDEVGHTHQFWDNFKFLLQCAIKTKVYRSVDYRKYPVTLCGSEIKRNPLY